MSAARRRSSAIDKLEEFRVIVLEHILKIALMPDHDAAKHWQKEIYSYQTRLQRYNKSKGDKPNYTVELLWEYIWKDQIDELPLGFIEEYGIKNINLNLEDVQSHLKDFIDGVLKPQ